MSDKLTIAVVATMFLSCAVFFILGMIMAALGNAPLMVIFVGVSAVSGAILALNL